MSWTSLQIVLLSTLVAGSWGLSAGQEEWPHAGARGKKPVNAGVERRNAPIAHNMRQIGFSDMDGRADGEQVVGQIINGRDYLFVGHYGSKGVTVLDATDPTRPEVVKFIPSHMPDTRYVKVQVVGTTLMAGYYQDNTAYPEPKVPPETGVVIWDVSDPASPKQLANYVTGTREGGGFTGGGTHKFWFNDGRYAHLGAGVDGYEGNIYLILDLEDPANPEEVGRWWFPGQHTAGGETLAPEMKGIGAHAAQTDRSGKLGFYSILTDPPGGLIMLDLADYSKPQMLSYLDLSPPMVDGYFGIHNVITLDSRKLLVTMNEATRYRLEEPQQTGWVVDYRDPKNPVILSILPTEETGRTDLRQSVRYGPHNGHENRNDGLVDDWMVYISWFNGGVRVFDLSDPRHPVEAGYYIPPDPKWKMDERPLNYQGRHVGSDLIALQDVWVDTRGYLYCTDYNAGLFVLEYTGPRPEGSRRALEEARAERQRRISR